MGILIPILILYFSLAFYQIDRQSLWLDEVGSANAAESTEPLLTRGRWFGGRGPLYPALLHLWARWGTSKFTLRSFSALLGGITVVIGYLMGLRLSNRRVAAIGTTLLATSPFLIWYSQEVRYITLMITAALLAMYTFHLALSAKRLRWWLLYFGSLILAIAAFVVNILLPVAQGVYLMSSPARRAVLRPWLVCQLLVFALFIWWANDGHFRQVGGYWQRLIAQVTASGEIQASSGSAQPIFAGGSREFTVMALPYTFFAFSAGFSLGPSLEELHVSRSLATLVPHAFILAISALLFGGLFVVGVAALWRQPGIGRFLISWLTVPIVGALGVSALIPDVAYNVRYVTMALPAYVFILSAGIAGLRGPMLQMTLLAAVLLINGLSLANYYHNPRYSREDAQRAARYLEVAAHSRDIIVVVGNPTGLQYYYRGSLPLMSWGETELGNRPAFTLRLQQLNEDYERLWLVEIRPWEADPNGTVRAALEERYSVLEHREWPGIDIYAYQLH
jgi:uncharacterized membrane protein